MPPRKKTGSSITRVEALQHSADKRINIPTADAHHFVTDEMEQPKQLLYPRDTTLDPQLVWKGKDEQDAVDLAVDAPPIYIQEKIDPRVLIENLRATAKENEPEPEELFFDIFDGLDEFEAVDFYKHDSNWSNRMILGDSLQVMGSLAERESLRGQVQMVYIDPPYGIKFGSNWQTTTRKRDVKDGRAADTAREAEQIKAFRDTWELGIHSYLAYLRDRLVSARDLLSESGSVFVQIGDDNVHLVRSLLDEVFGSENYVSLITYKTTSGASSPTGSTNALANITDYIVWYAKDKDVMKYRPIYIDKEPGAENSAYRLVVEKDGSIRPATIAERKDPSSLPEGARLATSGDMTSTNSDPVKLGFPVEFAGRTFRPGTGGWKTNKEGIEKLRYANRLMATKNSLRYVRYFDDFTSQPINNYWGDTGGGAGNEKIYVVQTGTKPIQRCLLMCTDPGDLVLDPTCGSGTTAYVAEQWGRRWITIDTSRVALALARQRMMSARYPFYMLSDSAVGQIKMRELSAAHVPITATGDDIRHGFVYDRIPRIRLRSIAQNPDIREGMTQAELDHVIRRHANFEPLYDKPYEDKSKVRVSGPFTVESLTPHRSLSFENAHRADNRETISGAFEGSLIDDQPFEQSILENLMKAGIQNGKKSERIDLSSIEDYPGVYVQAVATSTESTGTSRIGIAIGPQYGTVSPKFIKQAAREALEAGDIDLLCVLGFAFDPQATNVTKDDGVTVDASDAGFAEVAGQRKLGRINVLFVRMNADLLMGEELKKTGTGNLFTVFGEPDIDVITEAGRVTVDLKGVDVFDPTTGAVRSGGADKIALWMIDTNYNEESFFVRHCYFTGGGDPFKKLKATLRSEIDAEAWESLYSATSRPFDKPETGRIAVKVINDFGDEVMKIYDV